MRQALLSVLLFGVMATPAMADTVDLATYRDRLGAAAALVGQALAAEPAARGALVEQARALLRATTAVRLADGSEVVIDDRAVASRIAPSGPSLQAALADVRALLELAGRSPAIDPAGAVAQLRQRVGEHRASDAEMTFAALISAWLERFLAGLQGAPPDQRAILPVLGGLGIAVLLVVLGILGRDVRERFRREVVLPELRSQRGPDPAARLREADEALRAGRVRDAIHAMYLYAIAALAARESIRYDPSLTDRELLARAGAIPHADALRDLVEMHDRVWYGLHAARAEDARRAGQLARRAAA